MQHAPDTPSRRRNGPASTLMSEARPWPQRAAEVLAVLNHVDWTRGDTSEHSFASALRNASANRYTNVLPCT